MTSDSHVIADMLLLEFGKKTEFLGFTSETHSVIREGMGIELTCLTSLSAGHVEDDFKET